MQSIDEFVRGQLAAWEVPGCAVAAVRDGSVVLAEGWGHRDQAAETPVTADTLFAIGSVTKAFTAAAVGALVDEGLLEWDRPLWESLPGLRLNDPVVSERVTITDLLAHRSGLPRHDLTWIGHPDRSRADLVRRLRFLPLSRDLRQRFQYCNLGYLVAGHLVEVLSGMPWEEFTRARLLAPLGMGRSNLSVGEMLTDPDHATAYERRSGVVVPVPARPVTALAPAGAINSCAADMTRWLLAQLGGGIDGYQTECMLLPDDGIGVVVLTNTSSSAMAPVVAYRVLDELLGLAPLDWFGEFKPRFDAAMGGMRDARGARRVVAGAGAALPRPLAAYAGDYEHPGYGVLSIAADGATLRPRLGTLDLSMAHRHYETFDLEWHELGDQSHIFPLMFLSGPDGDITGLTVPFEPSVDPLRFDRLPEAAALDPEVLGRLTGAYAMGPVEIVVALRGDRVLTVAAPGTPPLELEPGRGLRFGVKGQPAITVEFEVDDAGAVTRLVAQPLGIFLPKP